MKSYQFFDCGVEWKKKESGATMNERAFVILLTSLSDNKRNELLSCWVVGLLDCWQCQANNTLHLNINRGAATLDSPLFTVINCCVLCASFSLSGNAIRRIYR